MLLQLFKNVSNVCDGLRGSSTSNSSGKYVIFVHFVKVVSIDIITSPVMNKTVFKVDFVFNFDPKLIYFPVPYA